MRLYDHLPPLLQGVEEYRALCDAVEEELDTLRAGIEAVRRNLVISTAEEEGLARWERALGISGAGSFSDRRAAVLSRMVDLPYSERRLKARLGGLVGENGYLLSLDGQTLRVQISLEAKGAYDTVCRVLENLVPANLVLSVSVKLTTHEELAALTHEALAGYTHEEIRNEVATGGGNNTELSVDLS